MANLCDKLIPLLSSSKKLDYSDDGFRTKTRKIYKYKALLLTLLSKRFSEQELIFVSNYETLTLIEKSFAV